MTPVRNIMWSLLGEGVPMAAALVSIPLLVRGVGIEGFGGLTLLWALLGYLAVLDMGLVRSLIQILAEKRSRGDADGVAALARPALAMIAGLGLSVGCLVAAFAEPLAQALTNGGAALVAEMVRSLLWTAVIAPVALLSAALRGVLEAHERFRSVNLIRIAMGTLNYLSPLAVLPFDDRLSTVVAAIAFGRVAGLAAFAWTARRHLTGGRDRRESLRPLLSMGGWMMLNNLIGPAMMYADRFVLAGLAATTVIAYYTTPFEVATRLLFIPTALSGVLFPMAAAMHRRSPERLAEVLTFGAGAMLAVFTAAQAGAFLFGGPLLRLWLGPEFAAQSFPVLQILMLGVALNAVAYTPYAVIQGAGRVDITAKLQMIELPAYLAVLWFSASRWGLEGAAAAWALRTGVDLFALLFCLRRVAPGLAPAALRIAVLAALPAAATVVGLAAGGTVGATILLGGLGSAAAVGAAAALKRRPGIETVDARPATACIETGAPPPVAPPSGKDADR